MKALSKIELLYSPVDDNDAVNKKYVDEHSTNIDLSGVNDDEILIFKNNNIESTEVSVKDLIYGNDDELIETEISNLTNADTLGGYTITQIVNIIKDSIRLDNVTNDKQVKAQQNENVTAGNIAIWGDDGSIVKDGGVTVKKSVPEDAVFTDTTYDEASATNPGLLSSSDKDKLDKLNTSNHIFFFDSVDEMVNHDMSGYPYQYAYGVAGTEQYRWRIDNEVLENTGKWRTVNEVLGDVIDIQNFQINDEGYLTVDIIQKDSSGNVVGTNTEVIQKILPRPKDEYDNTYTYKFLDFVFYNGIIWACKVSSATGITPSSAAKDTWMQCSDKPKDNYELYLENADPDDKNNPVMTYDEWAESLKGADGKSGTAIKSAYINDDDELVISTEEIDGSTNEIPVGTVRGKSAYDIAVEEGFSGTQEDWLNSLKGTTIATQLQSMWNINGILFDATNDVKNTVTCNTAADETVKSITVNNFVADGAILYILFSKGNACENISINVNAKKEYPVYYKNEIFDASVIEAGTILNLINNGTRFDVVGISEKQEKISAYTEKEITDMVDGLWASS